MTTQMLNEWIGEFIQLLITLSSAWLMPLMMAVFGAAVVARLVVYFMMKSENRFTVEFEKRVYRHRDHEYPETKDLEFHQCAEFLLNKTCHETYVLPSQKRVRRGDATLSLAHRLFMIQDGAYRLAKSTVENLQFCTKGSAPNFDIVATQAFNSNTYFGKVFGIIPIELIDDTLTILPGLFVVGGIFGTFIGIMQGLPILRGMDVTDAEASSKVLSGFIVAMAYSIGTSVIGVFLSVAMTLVNTFTAWDGLASGLVERFRNALVFLWMEREASGALAADPQELDATRASDGQGIGSFATFTVAGRAAALAAVQDAPAEAPKGKKTA